LHHDEAKFTDLGKCLQDVIVDRYLTKGASGAVYKVRYKGEECVMKIVINKDTEYLRTTNMISIKEEADALRKASELKIGPKFYDFRICKVKLPYFFKDKEITIGIFILERLDSSLQQYFNEIFFEIESSENSQQLYEKYRKILDKIILKIEEDCLIAKRNELYVTDIHPGNIMFRGDTPIIADWGIINNSYGGDCEKIKGKLLARFNDLWN
jgi:hypothetical protein